MSPNFMQAPKAKKEDTSNKATASEMEHALRKHITVHMEEDPALYGPLSEKLNSILQHEQKNWAEQAKQLSLLVTEVKAGRTKKVISGVTDKSAPFYEQMVHLVEKSMRLSTQDKESLKSLVNDLIPVFQEELSMPNFWSNESRVTALKGIVEDRLIDTGVLVVIERGSELAQDMVQLAKARHGDLLAA
jgi:type I restriction enzyme R subunit